MDAKLFFDAMNHVGLKTVIIDEDTVMSDLEPFDNGELRCDVLSKATYTAKTTYECIGCKRPIVKGMHYARVVVKPQDSDVQTQRWCLPCWLD